MKKKIIIIVSLSSIGIFSSFNISNYGLNEKINILNYTIDYLNNQTQNRLLFSSYLYKYHLEVERYQNATKPYWDGPYYFSPHETYLIDEKEYNLLLKKIKGLKKNTGLIVNKIKKIKRTSDYQYLLIKELNSYALNKKYKIDNFKRYNEIYGELSNTINNYFRQSMNLVIEIYHIYQQLILKKENNLSEDLNYVLTKLKEDIVLDYNLELKYLQFYKESESLEIDLPITTDLPKPEYFKTKLITGLSESRIIEDYRNYLISSEKYKQVLYNIANNKEKLDRIEAITKINLFYNSTIESYNNLITLLENTFPLEISFPFLKRAKIPVLYLPDSVSVKKNYILNSTPNNRIVFLLDYSYSMDMLGATDKLTNAISEIVPKLRSEDKVSIVKFSGDIAVISPMQAGYSEKELKQKLSEIAISNTAQFHPALELSYNILKNESSKYNRRIIVATDGIFNIDKKDLKEIANNAEKEIKISFLYFGTMNPNKLKLLKTITTMGRGRIYNCNENHIDNYILRELNGL